MHTYYRPISNINNENICNINNESISNINSNEINLHRSIETNIEPIISNLTTNSTPEINTSNVENNYLNEVSIMLYICSINIIDINRNIFSI